MRVSIQQVRDAIECRNSYIKESGYMLVLGGDIAGISVYEADIERHKDYGSVTRTLSYGATKREALDTINSYLPPNAKISF